jgi:hypothetical protein
MISRIMRFDLMYWKKGSSSSFRPTRLVLGSRISSRERLGQPDLLELFKFVNPHFGDQMHFFFVLGAHVSERTLWEEVSLSEVFVLVNKELR